MWNLPSVEKLRKIPKLYETDGVEAKEKVIHMHFFVAQSDWFVAEFDGKDIFFGFVCLNGWKELAEWGYFSFQELKDLKVKQPFVLDGERHVVELEVEFDEFWDIREAKDVKLISECQVWKQ